MVIGAFWMLRELEVSSARAALVEVTLDGAGRPRARLHLPATKTDQRALGASRSHGCGCPRAGPPVPGCPAHAAWDQLRLLRARFPDRWSSGRPDAALPLFPTAAGQACSKSSVVASILEAADLLGVPRSAPDGSERVSGHSLRATGAQGLARAGLELWSIQLLGRWGSEAVRGYVRDAALSRSEEWAAQVLQSRPLDALAQEAAPQLEAMVRGGSGFDEALAVVCRETVAVAPQGCADHADLAEQLAPIVVEAIAGAGDFAPAALLADPSAQAAEEDLVQDEMGSVLVLNGARGVVHRALTSALDLPPGRATTACGWAFGLCAETSFPSAAEVPDGHRALCGRCLPRWRALRKRLVAPGGALARPGQVAT